MTDPPLKPSKGTQAGRPWGWRALLLMVAIVTLVRVVFLVWFCPYELVADEAHYWDWSRNLDLSYYSKGPGVAWSIALSTALFGDHEWAVRLPTAILSAITPIAAGCVACCLLVWAGSSRGDAARAAFWSALAILCIPVFHGTALLMTIDGPYVAFWSLSLLVVVALLARAQSEIRPLHPWGAVVLGSLLGLCLGIAFLYKYTILLIVPGLVLFVAIRRRALASSARPLALAAIGATLAFALVSSPVFIWNAREGWPTVRHLLGHLDSSAGDVQRSEPRPYDPMWTVEYVGAQIGLVGPLLLLMVMASISSIRTRRSRPAWPGELLLMCCGWPIVIIYFLVSFQTDVEGNWPIAGYVSLAALVGLHAPARIDAWRCAVREWKQNPDRPRRGLLRRQPETVFQILWHWSVGYGLVAAAGLMLVVPAAQLPLLDRIVPLYRLTGASEQAQAAHRALVYFQDKHPAHSDPIIITTSYSRASLLAYYMPGRPSVRAAASYAGGRRSSYDHFASTRLDDRTLIGRPALLVGAPTPYWEASLLNFEEVEPYPYDDRVLYARFLGLAGD